MSIIPTASYGAKKLQKPAVQGASTDPTHLSAEECQGHVQRNDVKWGGGRYSAAAILGDTTPLPRSPPLSLSLFPWTLVAPAPSLSLCPSAPAVPLRGPILSLLTDFLGPVLSQLPPPASGSLSQKLEPDAIWPSVRVSTPPWVSLFTSGTGPRPASRPWSDPSSPGALAPSPDPKACVEQQSPATWIIRSLCQGVP